MIQFTKMHGAGNDYIYIDDRKNEIKNPSKLSIKLSNRNYGIGSDGLILILTSKKADFKMRVFNADGSEAEMCGNGIRCFAKYVYDNKLTKNKTITVETLAGVLSLDLNIVDSLVSTVVVDMGEPILERQLIPMLGDVGSVINEEIHLDDGANFEITSVSMGNPHAIVFVEDVVNFPVEKYGPMIESHNLFPNRVNVEFVQVVSKTEVIQRTWERGSDETLACGTGASAVTVAAVLNKLTDRKIQVRLTGGDLTINWKKEDNHVYMDGPATSVFTGEILE